MIDQITQTITELTTFPDRISYNSSNAYAQAVSTWLNEQKSSYPELNTLITQLNAFVVDTNTSVDAINAVKDIVSANVNYKGDWVAGSYDTGWSVTHSGVDYLSKIDGNTDEPPSVNWKEVVSPYSKAETYSKTEVDTLLASSSSVPTQAQIMAYIN